VKVSLQDRKESTFACDVLLLPLIEGRGVHPYNDINTLLDGLPSRIITLKEFQGKQNQITLLHTQKKIKPLRILLIGLGKVKEITRETLRQSGGRASSYLRNLHIKDVAFSTRSIASLKLMPTDFLEGFLLAHYRFEKYKKEDKQNGLKRITILSRETLKKHIRWTEIVVKATHFARDLVNTPSNDMTPSALVKAARTLKNVSVKVIQEREAEKLGMGAFLSVTKGSFESSKFIVMSYKGKKIPPIVLIGKSITFDSGGLSLKPRRGMEKMKYDMAGGAAVLGVMKAASQMNLPLHLVGILPAAENLPGGSAAKPGDVVKTIEDKTIEIISTDAEGRLTLADALGYAKKFKPRAIIDIATLTGACPVALGNEAIAMMGNDQVLMDRMKTSSEKTAERVWQMPLFEEYGEYIKSDIADLKNSGGRVGSLVASGYFLKECAGGTPWIHLDIAGTAWTDKDRTYIPQGATGIGVRLLLNFLIRR
jgi:leucyl aminopeptidase